jgi:hypothetical protein
VSFVREKPVEFRWHAGLAVSQKQKSIAELHASAKVALGIERILEISSKSPDALGIALSAFNLKLDCGDRRVPVEVAFQSSKVFLGGGPYLDLLDATPRDAKADPRLKQSGRLRTFRFQGVDWPLQPATVFYDWLYLTALAQNPQLAEPLADYQAFTDIEFNPEKSINCQARSAALYVGLRREGLFYEALSSTEAYLRLTLGQSTAASQIALC